MTTLHSLSRRVPVPITTRPLLRGFAAECILRAFAEAVRGSRPVLENCGPEARRKSRKDAADAIRWIRTRSRWTNVPPERRLARWGSPAPPCEARIEYVSSFSWCCELLDLNEETIRRDGPPFVGGRTFRPSGGLANWRKWRADRGQKHVIYRDKPAQAVLYRGDEIQSIGKATLPRTILS
jgi:hypothetical protein